MGRKVLTTIGLVLIAATLALALTADEYYNRAATKYINGDLAGAESDLVRVLELNPQNDKAQELLSEVRKELGRTAPAVTTTTLAPAPVVTTTIRRRPAPRPTVPAPRALTKAERARELLRRAEKLYQQEKYQEAKEIFLEVLELLPGHTTATKYVKEIRAREKPLPQFLPAPPAKDVEMDRTVNELFIIGLAFVLVVVYIIIRSLYTTIKKAGADRRRQVCPDCHTLNPEGAEFCQTCGVRLKASSGITQLQKKWFAKFKWKRNPFTLDVIPGLFTGYSSQVNAIIEKASTHSGHILIYGDKGVGKTTMLRWLTDNLKQENHAIYIARPPLVFDDMIRLVTSEIKPGFMGRKNKYTLYEVEGLVKKAKKPVILLLDEAHEYTAEIEQQMRSLGDIPGVSYILAGLPETREKIKKDSPPFFDRIVLESYIDHLTRDETKEMIKKRIEDAGGEGIAPFTEAAIDNVFKMSKGRPRMVLKVCDWVMTDAIRNNLDKIGGEVGQDFPAHAVEAEKEHDHPSEENK